MQSSMIQRRLSSSALLLLVLSATSRPACAAATLASDGSWSRLALTTGVHYHSVVHDAVHDRLIVFGGSRNGGNSNDTYILPLAGAPAWQLVEPVGVRPTARNAQSAIYDPLRDRLIVFGGSATSGTLGDVWALTLGGTPSWTQLAPAGAPPTARWGHLATYDPVRDRMLVIGGNTGSVRLNDVWELSLSGTPGWNQLAPSGTAPAARWGHAGIYDPVGDRIVMFGGSNLGTRYNDAWSLALSGSPAWSNLTPLGTPPSARWVHGAAYDGAAHSMIVFGGYDGTNYLSDVWGLALDDTPAWTPLTVAGSSPTARWGVPCIYDSGRQRMVLFGGATTAGDADDLWTLSLAASPQWDSQLSPSTRAPSRYSHPAVYDPNGHRMILFGGFSGSFLNDLWALALTGNPRWSPLAALGTPPGVRHSHTATYDPLRNRILVIGGLGGGSNNPTPLNDVWALTLTGTPTWTKLTPAGTPPASLVSHNAVYDPVHDRIVIFRCGTFATSAPNEVWELSLAGSGAWTQLAPSGPPPSIRSGQSAIYDPIRGRMILFAGYGPFLFPLSDLWELTLGDSPAWNLLQGTSALYRSNQSAVYDPLGDRMIVFGGYNGATIATNDLWALPLASNTNFIGLSPDGPPPSGRAYHSAVYDPGSNRMLVFGGINSSLADAEVWALQFSGTVSVPPATQRNDVRLAAAFPDPAVGEVTIGFALPAAGHASLRVYDVSGRLVRTLVDGMLPAGPQSVRWDRRAASGPPALAGLYFYELRTHGVRLARRIVLIQ